MHRQTIDAYDADAARWLSTRYDADRPTLPAAVRFRELVGDGAILDLGCGPGQLLADLGEPSIGIDASTGMLALASTLANGAALVQGDAEHLPIGPRRVGGVWANFSLQHLPRASFPGAIRELHRVLRPGGHVEITMHRRERSPAEQPDGVRPDDDISVGRWFTYWTADDVVDVLEHEGLQVLEVERVGNANRFLARKPPSSA